MTERPDLTTDTTGTTGIADTSGIAEATDIADTSGIAEATDIADTSGIAEATDIADPGRAASRLPLLGKTALVTGVSRRRGIGFAVAARFAALGADVFIQHFAPHDAEQPWGADDLDGVRAGIRAAVGSPESRFGDVSLDLSLPDSPSRLIDAASALTGRVDILVCNHAKSGGDGSIIDMTPERLDAHWQVNARSTLLLTSAFAKAFIGTRSDDSPTTPGLSEVPLAPGQPATATEPFDEHRTGRVFWMTSGQQDGPMPGEVAYATSKAALAGITPTVAKELLGFGIVLNTINPGPVNTGYLDPETTDRPLDDLLAFIQTTPFGRFGTPDDVARLIGWLATDEGRWIVGRVIASDGGWNL
ncbi:SDR family oxidoreductase [Plantibacter sp. YIM 135347]|uniref:SDR family oxidoreductase n=1 Tax=Plantibacter sp. YIM 135347 TaxID=3423919 RepID=UPI003D34ADDE